MNSYCKIQIILLISFMILFPINLKSQKIINSNPLISYNTGDSLLHDKSWVRNLSISDNLQDNNKRNYHSKIVDHSHLSKNFPDKSEKLSKAFLQNANEILHTEGILDSIIYLSNEWVKISFSYTNDGNRLTKLYESKDNSSDTWVNFLRFTYSYDAGGNILSELYEVWDNSFDIWVNQSRISYMYEDSGNLLIEITEDWDSSISIWGYSRRQSYIYDIYGNILVHLGESFYKDTGIWGYRFRFTYTYDHNGNKLTEVNEYAHLLPGELLNVYRFYFTYDDTGNMVNKLYYAWRNESWERFSRFNYTNDTGGNILSELIEAWDRSFEIWVNRTRKTYTYDDDGYMLADLSENWDDNNSRWLGDVRYTYSYNNHGEKVESVREVWNTTTALWLKDYRHTYTYDSNGNMLILFYEDWDWETSILEWELRHTYTYDGNGNIKHFRSESRFGGDWSPDLGTCELNNNGYNDLISCKELNAYYSSLTAVEQSENMVLQIFSLSQNYPNPFNPSTTIEFSLSTLENVKIEIFNVAGQKTGLILDKKMPAGTHKVEFNGSNLSSGVYFYQIQAGQYHDVKKMVILK